MATTTNYSWTTPDDTSLVKDGAAAIRTLGSSIDTTTKALNPSTTLGDIEYRSATANTNTRLGIGTTGQILSVVGGVPAWATVGGGDIAWALVNTGGTNLTGAATITVSGITKDKLMILVTGASSASANSDIRLRINSDSTSKYATNGLQIRQTSTYAGTGFGATVNGIEEDINANTYFQCGTISGNELSYISGYAEILGAKNTGVKTFKGAFGLTPFSSGADARDISVGGIYTGTSAVSSISLISGTGNFDNGKIYVYEG
jgi:hypothetical protein